ncbi:MAG TPA: hypothetical protein VF916_04850, partial [Ktedonobacterales bacterium]
MRDVNAPARWARAFRAEEEWGAGQRADAYRTQERYDVVAAVEAFGEQTTMSALLALAGLAARWCCRPKTAARPALSGLMRL